MDTMEDRQGTVDNVTLGTKPFHILNTTSKKRLIMVSVLFGLLLILTGLYIISKVDTATYVLGKNSKLNGQQDDKDTLQVAKWHTATLDFTGPQKDENNVTDNPFLDYRLNVTFDHPTSGKSYIVPGYFAGNGAGGGVGNVWRVKFTPDEVGTWNYTVSFRSGEEIAINLDLDAGTPQVPDGQTGQITVTALNTSAPGFLKWGRLEDTGGNYLKFRDGQYWIKGGTNSPENWLAYDGFDNTVDQGGLVPNFLHEFNPHIADWDTEDPDWDDDDTDTNLGDGKGIIGALNYLAERHVNSIYFVPLTMGGDGHDSYPFLAPESKTSYDVSKLDQWNRVFEHAMKKGIKLHFVLGEGEAASMNWLDNGTLGSQRKLFYRELVARFGHNLAIKWNLSEEDTFTNSNNIAFAQYIRDQDPYDHPITLGTIANEISKYDSLYNNSLFGISALQYSPDNANSYTETIRSHNWVADLDENTTLFDADSLRKQVLYDVYFSGGNLEWYLGYTNNLDQTLEDFHPYETIWDYIWYARKFMEENLPFWEMLSNDSLLIDEANDYGGGQVFVKVDDTYAIYLPKTANADDSGRLNLSDDAGTFDLSWYNPRTGSFVGNTVSISGGAYVDLGAPPDGSGQDWVVLLKKTADPMTCNIECATDAECTVGNPEYECVVASGGDINWNAAGEWTEVIDLNTDPDILPGSGSLQTNEALVLPDGSAILQGMWRGNQGYTRTVPIIDGVVQWGNPGEWSDPISISILPGSGDIQNSESLILPDGSALLQGVWRGNQGFTRTVPIVNSVIQWGTPGAWSEPISISTLPGDGDIQSSESLVLPDGSAILQGLWRGNQGYTRTVPIVNSVIQWGSASSWSSPIPLSIFPGSGDMQDSRAFYTEQGSDVTQGLWRGNKGYIRLVPIGNRCRLTSNISSYTCTPQLEL